MLAGQSACVCGIAIGASVFSATSVRSGPADCYFLGAVLIGFGSGYYHLDPDNERFLWDRLEIMLTFMAWFAAIVAERVSLRSPLRRSPRAGRFGLFPGLSILKPFRVALRAPGMQRGQAAERRIT
jgi:hypothetical protein